MDVNELYRQRLTTPEAIAAQVESGWICCTDIAAAIPPRIINALGSRGKAGELNGVKLHAMLDMVPRLGCGRHRNRACRMVSGGGFRTAVNEGRGDVMPCTYRDVPGLYRDYVDIDAFFIVAAPMDEHGWFSTGVTGSYSEVLLEKAKRVYLEVNPHMPRTFGSPKIHVSKVTALCESGAPLPTLPAAQSDLVSETIGKLIAQEIPNGATFQLGIGAIPEAVGQALCDKQELGVHSELFTDSMAHLMELGVVTNERKPIHRGVSVAALAGWTERVYAFLDDNPAVMIQPVDYVNDPAVIAQHPNFISVNGALEVDFYGQVCAESMGTRHFSGSGGQADFVRGAINSKGGKSFIAFSSTAKGESVSRIRPFLTPGAAVTTSKNEVDHVVTEYGIAKLRGKTLSQRTKELISIAHPKFRDELIFEAKKQNILI